MIHTILIGKKVVLASASPRRRQIFKLIGLKVLHKATGIDESPRTNNPRKYVLEMSEKKAQIVAKSMDSECVVVAADTVVFVDKEILNKPDSSYQVADYLTRLSGKTHLVYTGVCVCHKSKCIVDYEKTYVTFKNLTAQEISDYIATEEPNDKAGAYGIQGYGSQFISKVNGCYFNVMGFPVAKFYEMIKEVCVPNYEVDEGNY